MKHIADNDVVPMTKHAYELPHQKYALWQEIGKRFGTLIQSEIVSALWREDGEVFATKNTAGFERAIVQLAQSRGVVLHFVR